MKRFASRGAVLCTTGAAILLGTALSARAFQGVQSHFDGGTDLQVRFIDADRNPLPGRFQLIDPNVGDQTGAEIAPGLTFFKDVGRKAVIVYDAKSAAGTIELYLPYAQQVYAEIVVDPAFNGYKVLALKPMDHLAHSNNANGRRGPAGINTAGPGPANDDCVDAIPIADGATAFSTVGATTDGPAHPGTCEFDGQTYEDIWFTYTASCTGNLEVSTCGTAAYDTDLVMYSGSCGGLSLIACNDDHTGCAGFSSILGGTETGPIAVTAGSSYLIRVGGFSSGDEGTGTVTITCTPTGPTGPVNDDCADAIPITDGTTPFDTTDATTDGPAHPGTCEFDGQTYEDIWYTYTASCTGNLTISTCDQAAYDTDLVLYDGSCGALNLIACNDDHTGCGGFSSIIGGIETGPVPVVAGNTYLIRVGGFSSGDEGPGDITISCDQPAEPPANDDCADAEDIPALPASVVFDNTAATTDQALLCGVASGPFLNVWYTVTGTGGVITATTCNAGTVVDDTKISVFCGDCGALECVDGNDDDCASFQIFSSTVSWCSQPGVTYFISVGNFSEFTAPGVIQLDVSSTAGPCVPEVLCLPIGACCLSDGTCVVTDAGDCADQGGEYQGDGTTCSGEAVADGGFEGGSPSAEWIEASTNFGTPLCTIGFCGTGGGTGPNSGDWWCWFGGISAFEAGSVQQSVSIPASATDLTFAFEHPVASGNGTDYMRVRVDGNLVFEKIEGGAAIGYATETVGIGAFADDAAHDLLFESVCDALSNFFVDDVSISSDLSVCETCYTIDFTTEDDGVTPLVNGQDISTPPEFGVHLAISGTGNNRGPAIFESTLGGVNDPGPAPDSDPDLLISQGNLLILQESPAQCAPGIFCDPDDAQDGGSLIFNFVEPVRTVGIDLVDIDQPFPQQGATVTLLDGNGLTRVYTVPNNWTGDRRFGGAPGVLTLDLTTTDPQPGFGSVATAAEDAGFDGTNVVRCTVALSSSGAVDNLEFCK